MKITLKKDIQSPFTEQVKILKKGLTHDIADEIAKEWIDKGIAKRYIEVIPIIEQVEKRTK